MSRETDCCIDNLHSDAFFALEVKKLLATILQSRLGNKRHESENTAISRLSIHHIRLIRRPTFMGTKATRVQIGQVENLERNYYNTSSTLSCNTMRSHYSRKPFNLNKRFMFER